MLFISEYSYHCRPIALTGDWSKLDQSVAYATTLSKVLHVYIQLAIKGTSSGRLIYPIAK